MKARLSKIRESMDDSFWFVPAVMGLAAVLGALSLIALDEWLGGDWLEDYSWLWSGGPDGARAMMATIAGSLITVISIVFSLTITTLAQTATHFGPRVLRNFTSDLGVQLTLGTFIATFIYCLLVMRTVRSVQEAEFVPYLTVNVGFLLTLASLAVLLYFIDHVAKSIQAENLIAEVGRDFQAALPVLFPKQVGEPHNPQEDRPPHAWEWKRATVIRSVKAGYLQRVDEKLLIRLAVENNLVIKLKQRPGDFFAIGTPMMEFLAGDGHDETLEEELSEAFVTGGHRTPEQDGTYPIQQLVEIAAHALSPGINEPFTAMTCLDWLGSCLCGVARSDEPAALRRDENHRLRVIAKPLTFEQITRVAFDQIRVSGGGNPAVMARLFQIITDLAPVVRRANDGQELIRQARIIGEEVGRISNSSDRERVAELQRKAIRALTCSQFTEN